MISVKNFFLYVSLAVALIFSACRSETQKLPIYGSRQAISKVVDGRETIDTVYQTIPDFNLLNQDSVYITNKQFDGKIYIADFFFTRCPTICPVMHRNMYKLYSQYRDNKNLKFISHSIDFRHDRPGVLHTYAKKLGVNDDRWQFVCGSKKEIYGLAENAYMSAASQDDKASGGFDHSGYLLLIDKHRRLRGAYLGFDTAEVQQLSDDLKILLAEND
jgi:protein SCO1/2